MAKNWINTEAMQPRDRWVTVAQAAQYAQICEATIVRWIKSGKLAASKPGREWRISMADLETLMKKGGVA